MKRILSFPVLCMFLLFMGCSSTPVTQIKHGNDFSNIRSEITLASGDKIFGYATLEKAKTGTDKLLVNKPGSRDIIALPINQVEKMVAEDQEFVVKKLITPNTMVKEGFPKVTTSMVKRLSEGNTSVQVYEYKYGVKNPKSPIKSMHTTWFVSFPFDNPDYALTEFGSQSFENKWDKWAGKLAKESGSSMINPGNIKQLLSAVKKYENSQNASSVSDLAK